MVSSSAVDATPPLSLSVTEHTGADLTISHTGVEATRFEQQGDNMACKTLKDPRRPPQE